jgi:hypothetical protein
MVGKGGRQGVRGPLIALLCLWRREGLHQWRVRKGWRKERKKVDCGSEQWKLEDGGRGVVG